MEFLDSSKIVMLTLDASSAFSGRNLAAKCVKKQMLNESGPQLKAKWLELK
jgi:hypothetical protein